MKALFTLQSAIDKSAILAVAAILFILPTIYPEIALAAQLQTDMGQNNDALVFKIKNPEDVTQTETDPTKTNQSTTPSSITLEAIQQTDPLVTNLKAYLQNHQSPLADSAANLITYPHWQRAIAISFVESHMCLYTPKYRAGNGTGESHNCSGIGGNNFKRYTSYEEWFGDMNNLLNQPNYVDRPIEKFLRYYVQPGSINWLNGVKKVESELADLEKSSIEQRVAMANTPTVTIATEQISQPVKLK